MAWWSRSHSNNATILHIENSEVYYRINDALYKAPILEDSIGTPITEEKGGICKDFFLNLYNILDSPLKFDKTPEQRQQLDRFYREKYSTLCEQEKQAL